MPGGSGAPPARSTRAAPSPQRDAQRDRHLDVERARSAAGDADARRARGAEPGPLLGLPITLKDSDETAGPRTACGRTDLKDCVHEQDAEAVRRLRSAGAVIIGKTNMPAGNQGVPPDPDNPACRRWTDAGAPRVVARPLRPGGRLMSYVVSGYYRRHRTP
ncbi:amidase family protein [Streptomyces canus]|uniref:amidase family protein n=1 Tax=Streptomyces canus TaxID=58343 RepID=UPI0038680E8D